MAGAEAPKTCTLCGHDVSGKPRAKDKRGRYFCAACFKRAQEHLQKKHAHAAVPDGADDGEPDLSGFAEDSGPPVLREQRICPKCDRPVIGDGVICTGCGYNLFTGETTGTRLVTENEAGESNDTVIMKGHSCGKCGYDLSKIKSLRCPECGSFNRIPSKRDTLAADSRREARMAYIKPAIYSVLGLGMALGIGIAFGLNPLGVLIYIAVSYLFGLVVYFLCSITFVGIDEPFILMALRLLAVYMIVSALEMVLWPVPSLLGRFGGIMIGHATALMTIMEIEYEDAWIVAALTGISKFVALMLLIWYVGGLGR